MGEGRLVGFKDALSMRGKIAFAEGQTHARLTAPVSRMLSIWASHAVPRKATEELAWGLAFATEHLEGAGPRVVGPLRHRPRLLTNITAAQAVDREFVDIKFVLLACFGCPWNGFGMPLA